MKWLKKNFLHLSIKGQLYSGVISVSVCVCILVFILLGVNIFILLNMSYTDILNVIDEKETQQLDSTSFYIDFKMSTETDFSKIGIQWLRNILENLNRNKDFDIQFRNTNIVSYVKEYSTDPTQECNEKLNRTCVTFKKFGSLDQTEFNSYILRLAMAFPIINKTYDIKFHGFTNQKLFNQIIIASNVYNTIFLYPFTKFNTDFNVNEFKLYFQIQADSINKYMNNYKNITSNNDLYYSLQNQTQISFSESILKSPILSYYYISNNQPYYLYDKLGIHTLSPKYINLNQEMDKQLNESNKIVDVILCNWESRLIDVDLFQSIKMFRGIKTFVTNINEAKNSVLTPSSCNYFKRFYELQNDKNLSKSYIYDNILDCFEFSPGKTMLNTSFFQDPVYYNFYVKKKFYLPLINKYGDRSGLAENDSFYYKIGKYFLPSNTVLKLTNSDFFTFTHLFLYIFKNETFIKISFHFIFIKILGVFTKIVMINLLVWYILILIIILLLFQVTGNITKPIEKLFEMVTCIGQDYRKNDTNEEISELDAGDKDINELIRLCINIIKGGFSDYSKQKMNDDIMKNIVGVYNNISYIKTNNLLVDEDKLDSSSYFNSNFLFFSKKKNITTEENIITETEKTLMKTKTYENLFQKLSLEERKIHQFTEEFYQNQKKKHFLYSYYLKEKIIILST
jgi:hypothetical protein